MPRARRDDTYSRVAIGFHWIIAAAVIANILIALAFPPLMGWHKAIGLSVLVLTVGRLAWRLAHRPPPLPSGVSRWEKGVAHAVHWNFYLLLLAMPVSGWLMVSGSEKRRPLTWFGAFDIPYLPVGRAVGEAGHNAHGLLGWLMIALVVLHIAAALRHHLLLRDRTLVRMAPVLER